MINVKSISEPRYEHIKKMLEDLTKRNEDGELVQIGVFWEATDGHCYSSQWCRSKWELIGMMQQQIIVWTFNQCRENEE